MIIAAKNEYPTSKLHADAAAFVTKFMQWADAIRTNQQQFQCLQVHATSIRDAART
jgi:hypothetical protein